MPNTLDLVNTGLFIFLLVAYGYVVYSAVAIRRTLATGVYRRQALGTGLIAIGFLLLLASNYFFATTFSPILEVLAGVVFYAGALAVLYWVDSSILSARRSDPLTRDTLGWSRLRIIVWVAAVLSISFTLGGVTYFSFFSPNQNLPDYLNSVFNYLFPLPIYLAALSGVIVMPIAARRSRDLTLRSHLEWLFLFIAIQLVLQGGLSQLLVSDWSTMNLIDSLALLLGIYPLYRSAKRLVPLYRFSAADQTTPVAGGALAPIVQEYVDTKNLTLLPRNQVGG